MRWTGGSRRCGRDARFGGGHAARRRTHRCPASNDAGRACTPTPGPATGGGYCDLFELALFTFDDAAPEAHLHGRVSPDGLAAGGCAVIDEVEVQESGAPIATLAGVGAYAAGDEHAMLASGPAVDQMIARCSDETMRFGGFGLIVRGRIDGGSFEAHCADAEGGGRWPPALRVTCHHNRDRQPFDAYAMVMSSSGPPVPFTLTELMITVPHGPGAALTSVDSTLHVIAGSSFFAPPPPAPFDSPDWDAAVSEGSAPVLGPTSDVHFSASRAAFDTTLCPPPQLGPPDPTMPPPPVMLVRFTGAGELGNYSSEAYVAYCNTITN